MRLACSAIGWTALVVVLLLVLPNLYHSSTTTSLPGGVQVTCDGNTGIDLESQSCFLWGKELLGSRGRLTAGIEPHDVANLDIERAFFGFIDRCTVTISIVAAHPRDPLEQVVPCRRRGLSY